MMTTSTPSFQTPQTTRPPRTVAVVSSDPQPPAFESVLHAIDDAVLLVGSTAGAYTRIKLMAPDLVIVCLSSDDVDGCQVLSMLALDRETARIPVVTFLAPAAGGDDEGAPTACRCPSAPSALHQ